MKSIAKVVLTLLPLFAMACSDAATGTPNESPSSTGGDSGVNATNPGNNNDTTASNAKPGERTLATCAANVDPSVPAFYKDYFACVDIALSGTNVVITTDGLPPHRTNYYGQDSPNYTPFDTSRGAQYHANPNTLTAKKITITIPVTPASRGVTTVTQAMMDGTAGTTKLEYALGPAGVALDGVFMFNPLAAPGDDIEDEKYTFDSYNAHPTGTHLYHYHTSTPGPLEVLAFKKGAPNVELFGIMCDGTVVLGCTELDGTAVSSATTKDPLDAQNGHVHDLSDTHKTVLLSNRYHTHMCPEKMPGTHKFTPRIQYYAACMVK